MVVSSRLPNWTMKHLWDLLHPCSCYLQWTVFRFCWHTTNQTPCMSLSCGQRAGTLGMDSAASGWSTTSTLILMLYMETRTMVVCATGWPLYYGSGVRETTHAGRLFPGVSSLEFDLHISIISYCSIISSIFYAPTVFIGNSKRLITFSSNCLFLLLVSLMYCI